MNELYLNSMFVDIKSICLAMHLDIETPLMRFLDVDRWLRVFFIGMALNTATMTQDSRYNRTWIHKLFL